MKKFSNYIEEKLIICPQRYDNVDEKLIINRNFKNNNYDEPNNEGRCLVAAYPDLKAISYQIPRISFSTFDYFCAGGKVTLPMVTYEFNKTREEGVFYYNEKTWLYLLFFNDTAKQILDDAIKNPDMEFDFNDYAASLNKEFDIKEPYKIGYVDNNRRQSYSKEQLQKMKDQIK